MAPQFRAAKSRSQRAGWSALFRHPVRRDSRGQALRTRRGLRTRDEVEADRLVAQLNQLLEDESYWSPSARERAAREFDARVVSAFYADMPATADDYWGLREGVLPLPSRADGFSTVLLVGPTGAGKTTLVRQIIGTDPERDRFPSTSTAKTTVFDIELIAAPGGYRAVVSFLTRDRVRHYIEECVTAAVSAVAERLNTAEVVRRLLEHSEQRFRLSYLLGTLPRDSDEVQERELEDEAADEDDTHAGTPEVTDSERADLAERLRGYVQRIETLGREMRQEIGERLGVALETAKAGDRDAFLELLEDALRDSEQAQLLIDDLHEDVESRFDLLQDGHVDKDGSGWPTRWVFGSEDRSTFLRTANRFSSNYAPNFGKLLTPLVQGIRVSGPFAPVWAGESPQSLVLIDGEGLGHTPESATSIPTAVTRRYDLADVIVLVDNATQPMVAGALAVLRSVVASGHETKLVVVFTHFDQVKGDNLPTALDKRNHVRASLDNAIAGVDAALPGAGRTLRRHLEERSFFLARIDEEVSPQQRATRQQLQRLLHVFADALAPTAPRSATPVYDLANLVLGAATAARQFGDEWDARLPGEHWTRVKALTRRLAVMGEDQYGKLMPVADLIGALQEQLRLFVQTPRGWDPPDAQEDARQLAVDAVARELFARLHVFVADRLWNDRLRDWQTAYERRGLGTGNLRKQDVRAIHAAAAPVPGALPTSDATQFLDSLRELFRSAATAAGARVV